MNKHFQMGKLRREECGSEPQEKKKKQYGERDTKNETKDNRGKTQL